jgi:hypothetical protein
VKIEVNQSEVKDPKLYLFDVIGSGGFCHRFKIKDAANRCPFCGREPIICPGCGLQEECPSCGRETCVPARRGEVVDPADRRLRRGGIPDPLIVESRDWDGSDWFTVGGIGGSIFVNTTAKNWLERTNVHKIRFKETFLNLKK